jgi:hypothetical protein
MTQPHRPPPRGPQEPVDDYPDSEAAYRRDMPILPDVLRPGTRTTSTDTDLTDYQYAFASAYCGAARFNASAAARIAGSIHLGSDPGSNPSRTLNQPAVQSFIREYLESLKTEGIRISDQRIEELVRMNNELVAIQQARSNSMLERKEAGERIPEEALSGLMIEVVRRDGSSSFELDKVLLDQRRSIFEDVAKNLGERDSRLQIAQVNISGDAQSAKSKLEALFNTSEVLEGEFTELDGS